MDLTAYEGDPLEMALQRELRRGERVLWQGRMLARVSPGHFGIWLFAVPWTAFALFWTAMAFSGVRSFEGAGVLGYAFPLFGTPFIAVGLGMLSLPFLPLIGAKHTMFAVTNQRLIRIFLGGRRLWTKSVEGDRIGEIDRRERPDGSGTLQIAIGSHRDSDGDRVIDRFGIGEVADVMQVEQRVRQMIEETQRARSAA
jgi:hypothetical protein